MAGRHALVIGARCAAAGPLSFLPGLAEELYEALTDAALGGCVSALPDRSGLLLDPSMTQLSTTVTEAFAHADATASTLLLAFVGHGQLGVDHGPGGRADFYLLPSDCDDPERPTGDRAWLVGTRLRELLRVHDRIDGLVLLLDACHSGQGAVEVARLVSDIAMAAGRRFEVLTATHDGPAADGCFTRRLVDLLRHGHSGSGDWLTCADAKRDIVCAGQVPQHLSVNGAEVVAAGDPGLWLAPNWRRPPGRVPPPASPYAALAEQLTTALEVPPTVEGLVARARRARWVGVHGPAGSGKSTLVTALARPELAAGAVPDRFVHAVVYADRATTVWSLAEELRRQLLVSVPGFHLALAAYRGAEPDEARQQRPPLVQFVAGPLRHLPGDDPVRLVVDGLDQLDDTVGEGVTAALVALATDPDSPRVHVVVTSREPGPDVPGGRGLAVDRPAAGPLARYLRRRGVPDRACDVLGELCARGTGAWLLARLLADTYRSLTEAERDELLVRLGLGDDRAGLLRALIDRLLDTAGAADPASWTAHLLPVLTPLVAAGAGPTVPIELLAAAADWLDGPDQPAAVRGVLARLDRLVVRAHPGTARELVGLAHPALVDHLVGHPTRRLDPAAGRRILLNEIEDLAPITGIYTDNPLYRWAAGSEAEFHWQNGQVANALRALRRRPLPTPRQNLDRWAAWLPRVHALRGPDHPDTLTTRHEIAYWTGQAGDPAGALDLLRQLLPDRERVLGPHHPGTLNTRHEIASWTGQTGDPAGALDLLRRLLPDRERVLGPHHPGTLNTRHEIASWTGQTGDPAGALDLFHHLLPDLERVLGPRHPDTLTTRHNIAYWTGQTGDPAGALDLSRRLLPDRERVLGPHHPDTLTTRHNIAYWARRIEEEQAGRAGDREGRDDADQASEA
ncbi:tetratricopeptide repeat protein [Frankia sp. QA3]|uniref:tetratricopeptide repeat protein n=1 Tax=Frankia sp. QA3 TaxID=710111 RepID=UPI0012FA46D3|nr:tetratricopeptide repeat protein [Frankia sp. QA3]